MKIKLSKLLTLLLALLCLVAIVGCDTDDIDGGKIVGTDTSELFNYELSLDGKYYIITGVNDKSVTEIKIPTSYKNLPVKGIGSNAFNGCHSLKDIEMHSGLNKIDPETFEGIDTIEFNEYENGFYLGYDGNPYLVLIKADNFNITTIKIPEGTMFIYYNALKNYKKLESIIAEMTMDKWKSLLKGDDWDKNTRDYVVICIDGTIAKDGNILETHKHAFTNYVSDNNATCTEDGTKTAKCDGCDVIDVITDTNTKLNHLFTNYISNNDFDYGVDGTKTAICDRDGCNATNTITDVGSAFTEKYSEGLEFTLNKDGQSYSVTGIGTCKDTKLMIPPIYNGLSVTHIGEFAFLELSGTHMFLDKPAITSVVMTNRIISIGDGAFMGCSVLKEVILSDKVTRIGSEALYDCVALESITIPNSVEFIGFDAFYGCTGLKEVHISDIASWCNIDYENANSSPLHYFNDVKLYLDGSIITTLEIPNGVTKIPDCAFKNQTSIKSAVLPEGITEIAAEAFSGCTGLTSITLPSNLTSIGASAFLGCEKITNMIIPEGVTTISNHAFYGCTGLTSIIIPEGATTISDYAFCECTGLVSVTIPKSVTRIANAAFENCVALKEIYISDLASWCSIDFAEQGQIYYDCAINLYLNGSLVSDLVIPEGVTKISNYAFSNFSSITRVSIPSSLTSIGELAFHRFYKIVELYNQSSLNIGIEYYALNVYTPESGESRLHTVGDYIFYEDGDTVYLVNYIGNETKLTLPDNYNGKSYAINKYAFYAMGDITEVTIPDGITSIGAYAFDGCTGIKSITIPRSVTRIDFAAFAKCTALQEVHISDIAAWCNIDFIGEFSYDSNPLNYADHLYLGDSLISELVIPEGVTKISSYAFCSLPSITGVRISSSVISIGNFAFSGCTGLTSITLPSNLTSIGHLAFSGCTGFTSITIPSNVTTIGAGAFSGCTGIKSVSCLVSHVSSLSKEILKEIIITGGETIGQNAFYGCTELTSIIIPDSITRISYDAFVNCTALESITIPFVGERKNGTNNTYFEYIFGSTQAPSSLKTVVITGGQSISNDAFYGCTGLTSITIPDSVTSIGDSAFSECTGLTSITIPNSVTSIGYGAFAGCTSLVSISVDSGNKIYHSQGNCLIETSTGTLISGCKNSTIPTDGSVTSIGNYAFSGYTGLTSINIPGRITSIGDSAFSYCTELTSINISGSVTSIGNSAFRGCRGLTSITIPDSVTSIGVDVFFGCTSLQYNEYDSAYYLGNKNNPYVALINAKNTSILSCEINSYTKVIAGMAFLYCTLLNIVTIPDCVVSIGEGAFFGCSELECITVPDSVTSIGLDAFGLCEGLTSITIPFVGSTNTGTENTYFAYIFGAPTCYDNDNYVPLSLKTVVITGNNSIGNCAFYGCSGLTSVTIPDSITSIGEAAFYRCTGLTSVTFGTKSKLETIGSRAFEDCTMLAKVIIPDSVTCIDYYAFMGCTELTRIVFTGTTAEWNAITKGSSWAANTGEYTVYCTDGNVSKSGVVAPYES